jgi:hypothetical protein
MSSVLSAVSGEITKSRVIKRLRRYLGQPQSFLVLFFKKELLPCYADVLVSTQVGPG